MPTCTLNKHISQLRKTHLWVASSDCLFVSLSICGHFWEFKDLTQIFNLFCSPVCRPTFYFDIGISCFLRILVILSLNWTWFNKCWAQFCENFIQQPYFYQGITVQRLAGPVFLSLRLRICSSLLRSRWRLNVWKRPENSLMLRFLINAVTETHWGCWDWDTSRTLTIV